MKYLALITLLLALHLPAHQVASLVCTVRYTNGGQAVCWCKVRRAGSRWQVYPMPICQLVNR